MEGVRLAVTEGSKFAPGVDWFYCKKKEVQSTKKPF